MKYILGIFAAILILIIVIVLVIRGLSGPSTPAQSGSPQVVLSDYADKPATFTLTAYGPVTADELRETIVVSVSAQERLLQVMRGYEQTVIFQQRFGNNTIAYQTFLSALDVAGYSNVRKTNVTQPTGECPFGQRFVYGMRDGSEQIIDTWNTSCSARGGSFGGDGPTVRKLFTTQIPDYQTLVNNAEEAFEQ